MGFMQNITNKRKISGNAFPMKNVGSYVPYLIGNNPFFYRLDTTLFDVLSVVLLCWFWKCTIKKLHYLNNIESPWDMDKSTSHDSSSNVR
jgi:hypothetical protein